MIGTMLVPVIVVPIVVVPVGMSAVMRLPRTGLRAGAGMPGLRAGLRRERHRGLRMPGIGMRAGLRRERHRGLRMPGAGLGAGLRMPRTGLRAGAVVVSGAARAAMIAMAAGVKRGRGIRIEAAMTAGAAGTTVITEAAGPARAAVAAGAAELQIIDQLR